jgi:hypothetical protein
MIHVLNFKGKNTIYGILFVKMNELFRCSITNSLYLSPCQYFVNNSLEKFLGVVLGLFGFYF